MRGRPTLLTTYERDLLTRLWSDPEMSRTEAAAVMGRSHETIRKWARALNLPTRPYRTRTTTGKAVDLWPEGVRFEDDPRAVAEPFNEANAYRNGLRYVRGRHGAASSLGGRQI